MKVSKTTVGDAKLNDDCYLFVRRMPKIMKDWPKTTRMGIGRRLEENAFNLFEHAHGATNAFLDFSLRIASLQEMSRRCDIIASYLDLSKELNIMPEKIYFDLSKEITDIGRQVGGLGNSLREKMREKLQSEQISKEKIRKQVGSLDKSPGKKHATN